MIKPTNKPAVETIEALNPIINLVRGAECTIGNGSTRWTIVSGYINGQGGYTEERGVYPSAIVLLRRRDGIGGSQVFTREAHLNQLKLAN